jgi:nucleoside-diphosphate-sugar epimerase
LGCAGSVEFGALPPQTEPPLVEADITRLRTGTRWAPTWNLEQGLESAIAWWQAELSRRA